VAWAKGTLRATANIRPRACSAVALVLRGRELDVDPVFPGRHQVDVVRAPPPPADDLELAAVLRAGLDDLPGDLGGAAHQKGVEVP
jgi:hypothetical protein